MLASVVQGGAVNCNTTKVTIFIMILYNSERNLTANWNWLPNITASAPLNLWTWSAPLAVLQVS